MAVGEFNTILTLDDQGHMARADPGNLPPGNILFIDGNDSAGWFAAVQHGKEVTVLRSTALEGGDWQPLRKENVETSFWSGPNQFWAWSTKTGFAYAVSEGRISFYDLSTRQWIERKAPKGSRFIRIAPQTGDTLGALTSPGGGVGGIFASTYLSRDAGSQTGIATIRHSDDEGKTWRIEYSNFDEAAYQAQKQKSK